MAVALRHLEIINIGFIGCSDIKVAALAAGSPVPVLEQIIEDALRTKKHVVEQDEKEHGLRRVLNFGHTLGHGIESLMTTVDAPMPLEEALGRAEELYYLGAVRMFRFIKVGMDIKK